MIKEQYLQLYEGKGKTIMDRGLAMPEYEPWAGMDDPGNYLAEPGLKDAVNVALALGQPLLVTGEPGTGKTCLAQSVAWELGLNFLTFQTKTTSEARDLFYHYDALRRFQDIQLKEKKTIETYISCQALGLAILLANPTPEARVLLPEHLKDKGPMRSVVLIDEIDKAPRDLPNDLLNEVEKMTFSIRETDMFKPFTADPEHRPILVLTSNSEKDLPDAFLRRCVFYHIAFPDAEMLKRIVSLHFNHDPDFKPEYSDSFLDGAYGHFKTIRKMDLKKQPSTAEYLAWISILKSLGLDLSDLKPEQKEKLALSYSVLAKTHEDLERLLERLEEKLKKM